MFSRRRIYLALVNSKGHACYLLAALACCCNYRPRRYSPIFFILKFSFFSPFFFKKKKNSDLLSVSLFLPSSFLHSVHTEISFVRLPVRPSVDLSLAGNRLSVEAGCAAAVADRGSSSNVVDAVSALLLPLLLLLLASLM